MKTAHIDYNDFTARQPLLNPDIPVSDYYFDLNNSLIDIINEQNLLEGWSAQLIKRAVLNIVDYLQDIVSDCGIWRSFIKMCNHLYGKPLPFFKTSAEYIEHELNPEDIRFILWYSLALNSTKKRQYYPLSADIEKAARIIHSHLDSIYDEAPISECWQAIHEIELYGSENATMLYRFGNWLYMKSYLMNPSISLSLYEIVNKEGLNSSEPSKLEDRFEKMMMEEPCGPIALYLKEWLFLILEDKIINLQSPEETDSARREHPYWKIIQEETNGDRIMFFKTYKQLNEFFIDKLGWNKGEDHLPSLKGEQDFVILADQYKGILVARGVAQCIKYPNNPYYNKEYAETHAINLLTERGRCPADLLKFLEHHNAIPDAKFPDSGDSELVRENYDFISRCYLQLYYRGD